MNKITHKQLNYILDLQEQLKLDKYNEKMLNSISRDEACKIIQNLLKKRQELIDNDEFDWSQFHNNGEE